MHVCISPYDKRDWMLKNIYSQTFKNWVSRKMCQVYAEACSIPHEALGCIFLKLGSTDPEDPGPLRFHDHLFIHTIHSLIHSPEEPQASGWQLSQQLSRQSPSPPTHESLTRCPLLCAWKYTSLLKLSEVVPWQQAVTSRNQSKPGEGK